MTARFIPSTYPGGRIVLRSGHFSVGAVFPPWGKGQHLGPWLWSLWVNGQTTMTGGAAETEIAAKTALLQAWKDFLASAALTETQTEDPAHG